MIDPLTENVVSLTDAAKDLPRRRGGKRPHPSCLYRWTMQGCKGVVLESTQVGGTRCTSLEALGRFFNRLSEQAGLKSNPRLPSTSAQRARRIEKKNRDLNQDGW